MASPSASGDATQNIGSLPSPRKKRNSRRPETREKISPDEWPNLRDHGLTLDSQAPRLLQNLQRERGYAFFTEAGIRKMHTDDVGHAPGVGTFPAWLDRAAERGEVHQLWLTRGGTMPDGSPCKVGVRLVRFATSDKERARFREDYAANIKANGGRYRRERTQGGTHRAVYQAMRARGAAALVVRPVPRTLPEGVVRLPDVRASAAQLAQLALIREAPS